MKQIGTVEILMTRTYPLDTEAVAHSNGIGQEVVVQPGVFPLYHDGLTYLWLMTGELNFGGPRLNRVGDGMFTMGGNDLESGLVVTFPSHKFGLDEWEVFTTEPVCQEGNVQQRLRIKVSEEVSE